MRRFLFLLTLVCVAASASPILAGPVADSIAFQGRLTDASDTPVPDGSRELLISVWTDSVGGTMLHNEIAVITTSKGLYSTCIGCGSSAFPDIFDGQTLYLQTQLVGQAPMTPRTKLRSVPYALSSSSVHGEWTNGVARGKGIIANKPSSGNPHGFLLLDHDSDGDGHEDFIVTDSVNGESASSLIGHDTNSDGVVDASQNIRVSIGRIELMTRWKAPEPDGPESGINALVDADSASQRMSHDLDGDGVPETSMSSSVQRKSGSIIYLDREGNEVVRSMVGVDSTRGIITTDHDSDGDNVPESEAYIKTLPLSSSVAIKTKGTAADGNRSMSISATTNGFSSAVHRSDYDDDGDGVPEQEISQTLTPVSSNVAIKTKGTKADANRVIGSTDDSTATVLLAADSASISMRTKHTGVIKGNVIINHANRSVVDLSVEDTATSATSSLDLDGDALLDVAIIEACTPDSTSREVTYSYPNSAAPTVLMKAKEKANRTKCSNNLKQLGMRAATETEVACDTMGASTFWRADDFSGAIKSVTIQASTDPLVNPIEHSSGAHLTPGGVWTNASDENLKENFQPVDGAELLEKIDELTISEWNYRTEPDEIKHIGPTAQDFQATFGVGSDGTSISTIDPSGIALAAIKELSKKNQRLEKENQTLRKELDELKQMVRDLAHTR